MKTFLCKLFSCLGFGKKCPTEERRVGDETRRHYDDRRDPQTPRRNEGMKDRRDHHEN